MLVRSRSTAAPPRPVPRRPSGVACVLGPDGGAGLSAGLDGWDPSSPTAFDTAISGDTASSCRRSGCRRSSLTTARREQRAVVIPRQPRGGFKSHRERKRRYIHHESAQRPDRPGDPFASSEASQAWWPDGTACCTRTPTTRWRNADRVKQSMSTRRPNARPVSSTARALCSISARRHEDPVPRISQDLVDHSATGAVRHERRRFDVVQLTQQRVFDSAPGVSPTGAEIAFEPRQRRPASPSTGCKCDEAPTGPDALRRLHPREPAHDEGPIFSPKQDEDHLREPAQRPGGHLGHEHQRRLDDPARRVGPTGRVPFDMTGHTACTIQGGRAWTGPRRRAAVPVRHRAEPRPALAAPSHPAAPPARLRGYACTTAPHTFRPSCSSAA